MALELTEQTIWIFDNAAKLWYGHRKTIHKMLIALRDDFRKYGAVYIDVRVGICYNLHSIYNSLPKALDEHEPMDFSMGVAYYARNWPKHSGELFYPVEGEDTYIATRNKWINPDRLELLDYLIRATR